MDRVKKESTNQFHKIFFLISKCLASNAGKTLQLKITKKKKNDEQPTLYKYVYEYIDTM